VQFKAVPAGLERLSHGLDRRDADAAGDQHGRAVVLVERELVGRMTQCEPRPDTPVRMDCG
jgi:hypothetical protein